MTLLASLLLRLVEKKMDGSDSYELVQADSADHDRRHLFSPQQGHAL